MNQFTQQPQQYVNAGAITAPIPSQLGSYQFHEEVSWDDIDGIESDSFELVPAYQDVKEFYREVLFKASRNR